MAKQYIFTVTAGRSGQNSLAALLNAHVPGCHAAFEEPHAKVRLKGALGDVERRFRRRFFETHELLGRGRVLTAFQDGDEAYLDRIAAKRLGMAEQLEGSIYVDVSKYFARGLHNAFARAVKDFGLIRLVRDPILNMRSFLNRGKGFYLDNSAPDAPRNLLLLDPSTMSKGELYLWAWCEVYLRFDRLVDEFEVSRAVEIRTEDLNDGGNVTRHFRSLGLDHSEIRVLPPRNTNRDQGRGDTIVKREDIETMERFLDRLPGGVRDQIAYFSGYEPARAASALGA